MITTERTSIVNLENAIHGAHNPMNSWNRMDSLYDKQGSFVMEPNDLNLAQRLARADSDRRRLIRQIFVSVNFIAPLYWWKEYDTYKAATVTSSTSTMRKVASKPFTLDDFSHECMNTQAQGALAHTVSVLEGLWKDYLEIKGKETWCNIAQLLPSSYHQMRTCTLNYETLMNIHYARRNHRLDEQHIMCDWIASLPYVKELILAVEEK